MSKGRIPLEELASLPSVMGTDLSWSGEQLALYWNKTGRMELYLLDLRTREVRQLSNGQVAKAPRVGFVWTRDDRAIIFGRDKDGDEKNNLFRIDVATGKVDQLNDDPLTQEYPGEVHPDNRRLAVMSTRSGQLNVHTLDLQTLEWRQLTRFKTPANATSWSPDGQWLAFNTNETPNFKNQDGYLMRHDGSETQRVFRVAEGSSDELHHWHPSGKVLSVSSDATGTRRVGLLTLETGVVQWLTPEGIDETPGDFSADGRRLFAIRNQDSALMPVVYDVATGAGRVLQLPPGMAMGIGFVLGGTNLLVQHTSATSRPELLLYNLAADTYEVLLPADYGSIDPNLFVADEYVKYPSYDGRLVPALLYKPRDIAPGERRPAVVIAHGGPTSQFFRGFAVLEQFLVDQGYVLLEPNVRGSTGYGVEWRDMAIHDWGGGDLEDVAAGVRYLHSLPYVDPERIGIYGVSYGGYMSYIAVTKKPDLFKVGVPVVGMSDLHKLYEEDPPQFQYYLQQQLGDPVENSDLYSDRSAVTHAANLKAKLLIIHGLNDPRCPISQARGFRDKLVALGRREGEDFEYHEFDEGHGPGGDPKQRIRNWRLVADFLERRL